MKPATLFILIVIALVASLGLAGLGIECFFGNMGPGKLAMGIPFVVPPLSVGLSASAAYVGLSARPLMQRHVAFLLGTGVLGFLLGPLVLRLFMILFM